MKKPRIAIPEPTSNDIPYNERSWPQYAHAVERAGGEPVKIELLMPPAEVARLASSCDGLLLPGSGSDVNPEKYGQKPIPECAAADPAREAVDELLIQDAANLQKPFFGICYGFQSWNVWRGGTLVQDLKTSVNHKAGREIREAHRVFVAEDSRIAVITGTTELMVNSSHHQALDRLGNGLRITARSTEDGVIEAVEGSGHQYVIAVQWHPERTFDSDPASRALFGAFVDAAAHWQPPFQTRIGTRVTAREVTEAVVSAGLMPLHSEAAELFAGYVDLLVRWNARLNLTAVREPNQIIRRHLVECVLCAQKLPDVKTLLDFGSGAGLPGIPIAILRPEIEVTLGESQGKKASFLREAVRTLGLNAQIYDQRIENMAPESFFDAVTLRAVDRMQEAA
ncbi:MAG TPA: 16S rRNA (guanine(527)-N(7))-methyltransferase RsmG, partial [Silvibacterium sp.]|nr:16S rRNA (guanine(527)-N(7))-methyltransferase RsmG [Silvibacterium sp.]